MRRPFVKLTTAAILASSLLLTQGLIPSRVMAAAETAASLSQGTRGTDVSNLQTNLKALGFFSYPLVTGYYGSTTSASVSAFQKKYGLAATGTADSDTLRAVTHAVVMKKLAADTVNYLRVPYAWGGASPKTGFDCSGFVYFMLDKFGVPAVRTTSGSLYKQGTSIPRADLMPGDLVFFGVAKPGTVDHVGFYTGDNRFISATSSKGIYIQSLDSTYWGPKYIGAKRIY